MPIAAPAWAWRGDPHVTEVADRLKTTETLLRVRMPLRVIQELLGHGNAEDD